MNNAHARADSVEKIVAEMRDVLNDMRPISPCLTEHMERLVDLMEAALSPVGDGEAWAVVVNGKVASAHLLRDDAESQASVYGSGPRVSVEPLTRPAAAGVGELRSLIDGHWHDDIEGTVKRLERYSQEKGRSTNLEGQTMAEAAIVLRRLLALLAAAPQPQQAQECDHNWMADPDVPGVSYCHRCNCSRRLTPKPPLSARGMEE